MKKITDRPLFLFLALALLGLLLGGCARASRQANTADVQMELTAVPDPAAVGDAQLLIRLHDSAGNPINDARLSVKGDMSHAGMQPVLAELDGGSPEGVYEVPFTWTMAGDWIVTVEATLPDGAVAQQRFEMAVAAASGE